MRNKYSLVLTKQFLLDRYIEKQLSAGIIAKSVGCAYQDVIRYLYKYKIPVRSLGEANLTSAVREYRSKLRQSKKGELSSNWKGGISSLYVLVHSLSEYADWRAACFKRDFYTCKKCDKSSGKLECHHSLVPFQILFQEFLKQYSQFSPIEDKETLTRLATTWKPFWDTNNGETLCRKCHELERKITYRIIRESK